MVWVYKAKEIVIDLNLKPNSFISSFYNPFLRTNFAKPKIPVVTTVLNNHDKNLLKKINDVGYKRIERRGVGDWKKIYNSTNRFKSRSDFKVKGEYFDVVVLVLFR